MTRYLLVLACACSTPARAPIATIASDATTLVDAWATAVGGRDRVAKIRAVHAHGKAQYGGVAGRYDRWETARGERRDEIDLGAAGRTVRIFDGAHGWLVDRNHAVRDLDGPELAEQLALAFVGAAAPLVADRRAGRIARRGDTLVLEPASGRTLTVTFDPATRLPKTIARRDAEKTRVIKLADWREVDGVRFPFAIEDGAGDPRDTITVHLDGVELDANPPAFVRPADGPHDWHLAAGRAVIPVEIVRGLVVAQVRVNGSPPLAFLVDTGAEVTVINASRVDKIGLHPIGSFAVGAGGGDVAMSYLADVSFALPGATLEHQIVTAIPLDDLEPLFGHPIDGVLGYDFLSRFVVELDYDKRTLALADPATFAYAGTGRMLPVTLEGGVPNAEVAIGVADRPALPARFIVDTGCSCEVSFNAPFTAVHKLLDAVPDPMRPPGGVQRGAGGETQQVFGHIASLAIAGATVTKPLAEFAEDKVGAGADPESAGLLGAKLWRRFVVTFDYAHKRMWLQPNAHLAETGPMIGIGVVWRAKSDRIGVMAIVGKSPAEAAGFAVGDELVSFDGTPADKLTIDDIQPTAAGTPHTYVVRRAGKTMTLTVTPRALF